MLAILSTHPIQYQVPLWQLLARDGTIPFEVWYLSRHATDRSRDREFGKDFAWDIDMLQGYPHRFLKMPDGSTPNTPFRLRIAQSLPQLFNETGAKVLWVQGWQVWAYWQAVWAAKHAGLQVWLRGESNNLAPVKPWKALPKRILLGQFFNRVDQFLCIGNANRDLYRSYGVPEKKLHLARYAVDNDRFREQAEALRSQRSEIRSHWKIPEDAICILFCGKFITKKRPLDLIAAAQLLLESKPGVKIHLLFVGSGELGEEMRRGCNVLFDAENPNSRLVTHHSSLPAASFTGFLNQTEISRAYVAADVLVLPSDYSETWGLVVNEAMASELPCIISDRCGCAPDLGNAKNNITYTCGDVSGLATRIRSLCNILPEANGSRLPSFDQVLAVTKRLYPGMD